MPRQYSSYLLPLLLQQLSSAVATAVASAGQDEKAYHVPSFELSELASGSRTDELAQALSTNGLIAVKAPEVQVRGLSGLCDCATSADFLSIPGTNSALLSDGRTTRTSLATATMGTSRLPLASDASLVCGIDTAAEMESVRDLVATASKTFVTALDHILLSAGSSPLLASTTTSPLLETLDGDTYSSVASIVKASSNLEHFHVYSKESGAAVVDESLDWHTDGGLFLAFVPGIDCQSSEAPADGSFFVKDVYTGESQRAVFPPGAVGLMLGTGAENWLEHTGPLLRATRHAVRMQPGARRGWYGMMHLVPLDALVQKSPRRTFADMRASMGEVGGGVASLGCGRSGPLSGGLAGVDSGVSSEARSRSRLHVVGDASYCNNVTNMYCWMMCQPIPDAKDAKTLLDKGEGLYCVDPNVLLSTKDLGQATKPCTYKGIMGGGMDEACVNAWLPLDPKVPSHYVDFTPPAVVPGVPDADLETVAS